MLGHVDMDQSLFDEAIARLCRDAKGNDYQNYKYAIIAFMITIYLFTCYLNGDKNEQGDKNEKEKEKIET